MIVGFVQYFLALLGNINISFAQRLMSVASKRLVMSLQSCHFHVYMGQILAPCYWESGSAFPAPGAQLRCWALCAAALWVEVVLCRTRGFFGARDVFIQVMHACKSACVYDFFIPGCGCSRLALSVLRVRKTSSNNRRGEAEEGLSRRGVQDEGG